jgi:hypothetical protein
MTMADADKMLEWKNYCETRAYAIISQEEISKEAHYAWLEKNLQFFQVIQDVDMLGAIRIVDDEISIWIDREHRKKGVAKYIIDKVSYPGMTAKIANGNVYSFRAFLSAGFRPTRYSEDGYYTLVKE